MFLLIFVLYILPAANEVMAERIKRFLTPSTYPVPTTFAVPSTMAKRTNNPIASSLPNSKPISCPVKRDTRAKRVLLDSSMMREIYLREVGVWDTRLVAETIEEAKDNFIDLTKTSFKKYVSLVRRYGVLKQLFRHLRGHNSTNSTTTTNSDAKQTAFNGRRQHVTDINSTTVQLGTEYDPQEKPRTKRTADGMERTTTFCHPRGTLTEDGYKHMCSTCAFTSKLLDDRFPRYINEVGCDDKDCRCLTINNVSYGKCQPRIFIIKILRKLTSGCRLIIHDGQHLFTDNWELYDQPIQVGCECVMDKRSPFT